VAPSGAQGFKAGSSCYCSLSFCALQPVMELRITKVGMHRKTVNRKGYCSENDQKDRGTVIAVVHARLVLIVHQREIYRRNLPPININIKICFIELKRYGNNLKYDNEIK